MLLLLLTLVAFNLVTVSLSRQFWYDEVINAIMGGLPTLSDVWNALENAADTHPPLFYVFTRLGHALIADEHLGYRLPSILALLGTVVCIYAVLLRRVSYLPALTGATFLLCTQLVAYGSEARPYSLLVFWISVAVLAWTRLDDSKLYSLVFAAALAAAISTHYYALFVWPAFAAAEFATWMFQRRFRISSWIAMAAGTLPMLFLYPLVRKIKVLLGDHFHAAPQSQIMTQGHSWLYNTGAYWGVAFAVGITAWLAYASFQAFRATQSREPGQPASLPISEAVLIIGFLWIPVVGFVAAKVAHGGLTERYLLPTVLGGALGVGYAASFLPRKVQFPLFALLLLNYGLTSRTPHNLKSVLTGSLMNERAAAAVELQPIVDRPHEAGLPIVISSAFQYLPKAYYATPEIFSRFFTLIDPPAAVQYANTDSADLGLKALRNYFPLHVEDYDTFASEHPEFLLAAPKDRDVFAWWDYRLTQDGHSLTLLSSSGPFNLYRVKLVP